MEFLDRFS